MTKTELDPLRVILGVVAANRDSDLLLDVALAAGLRFDAALSDRASYSHKNRVRELLPRILAAHDALSEEAGLGAANALVAALSPHGEILEKAANALQRAGWNIREGELIVTEPDVREMFFPKGSQWDAFVVLKDIFNESVRATDVGRSILRRKGIRAAFEPSNKTSERPHPLLEVSFGGWGRGQGLREAAFWLDHRGSTGDGLP
jgi:hypothetical protein